MLQWPIVNADPAGAEAPQPGEIEALLKSDPPAAVERLRPLAQRADPQAQLLLGQLLVNGVGTQRNPGEALRWFRRAARAKVPMAMNMVGRCHEYGLGTAVDYPLAAHWYRHAAAYDCDWGLYNYAHLLAHGRGVERDRAAAFAWFKLAASRGHARSMHFLGQYYENGWETPVSRDTAFAWYRASAQAGDFRGQCSHASVLAEQGRIEEALHWLRLAAKSATPGYLSHLAVTLLSSRCQALRDFAVQELNAPAAASNVGPLP